MQVAWHCPFDILNTAEKRKHRVLSVFFKSTFNSVAFLGCPPHWKNFTDKCYYFSVEKDIFEDAKLFCEDKTSHLVFINSREEQVWYVSCTLGWIKL